MADRLHTRGALSLLLSPAFAYLAFSPKCCNRCASTISSLRRAAAAVTTRVALHPRVSTNHSQDPELQLRELRDYAGSRGWTIAQEYTEIRAPQARRIHALR